MNIVIIGGGGVVGQKLARALAKTGTLRGKDPTSQTTCFVESLPHIW